jgi:hypothetical protein
MLTQYANLCTEVNVIALVYVNRLGSRNNLALTMRNWRAVWLICIILAQKMWNDNGLRTSSFAGLVPPISRTDLRILESRVLQLLDYSIGVKPSLYAKYYFELRLLFTTIMGFQASDWKLKPLTIVKARRLDALNERKFYTNDSKSISSGTFTALEPPMDDEDSHRMTHRGSDRDGNTFHFKSDSNIRSNARFVLS